MMLMLDDDLARIAEQVSAAHVAYGACVGRRRVLRPILAISWLFSPWLS